MFFLPLAMPVSQHARVPCRFLFFFFFFYLFFFYLKFILVRSFRSSLFIIFVLAVSDRSYIYLANWTSRAAIAEYFIQIQLPISRAAISHPFRRPMCHAVPADIRALNKSYSRMHIRSQTHHHIIQSLQLGSFKLENSNQTLKEPFKISPSNTSIFIHTTNTHAHIDTLTLLYDGFYDVV